MSSQQTPSSPPSASGSRSSSPHRLVPDDEKFNLPSPVKPDVLAEPRPAPPPRTPVFPGREDCWSEEATRTLIDAWGAHYLNLNRGNLRQKHWQEVADAVNSIHAAWSVKLRRSDVQCKNRIDTTKKKFKVEKSKVVQSHGRYVSSWPHFESLDALIGDSFSKTPTTTSINNSTKNLRRRNSPLPELSPSPPPETMIRHRNSSPATNRRDKDPAVSHPLRLTWSVPVGPRSKRSGPGSVTERNFSVMAAAAAAMEAEEDDDDNDVDGEGCGAAGVRRAVGRKRKALAADEEREGYRMLAEAIMRLGQIYEKVEVAKQRQMMEFEKQRMQFAKDLEILRAQVQLDNLKRAKRNSKNSSYL